MKIKNNINIDVPKIIIVAFPLFFIIGSAILNIVLVIISLFVLWNIFKKKYSNIFKSNWMISYFIFYFYLVSISFLAEDFAIAFKSSGSQIRFFLLTIFVILFFDPEKHLRIMIFFWSILVLFVCLDTNLQFLSGIDIFGYRAEGFILAKREFLHPTIGRLGGPFGEELIAGSFIAKISPPLIFYYIHKLKNVSKIKFVFIVLFLLLLIETVLATGERVSFIIIFLSFLICSIFLFDLKKILIIILVIFTTLSFLISKSNFLSKRVNSTIDIIKFLPDSSYGRIYKSSYHLFKENLFFGTGLKNYYIGCNKLVDPEPEHRNPYCSPTHSHNFILQLLSETGIIGFFLFYIFVFFLLRNFLSKPNLNIIKNSKNRSLILGSLFFLLFSVVPNITPAGSFFTTWNGTFFWLHLGLVFSFLKTSKLKYKIKK